ncbi:hypothetical protein B0J11DRAFT_527443 [Dendryphion nanum]|uniref:Uncharacterized protein n=1 Tax=Dendryphion nanum TaxID=256645 RepID=A0A9P9DV95_9PLEO|nr:hypothetical protein B0J11DRAFT_527443 [Dendryphion nanum]
MLIKMTLSTFFGSSPSVALIIFLYAQLSLSAIIPSLHPKSRTTEDLVQSNNNLSTNTVLTGYQYNILPVSSQVGIDERSPWRRHNPFRRQNCVGTQNFCFGGTRNWCQCSQRCCIRSDTGYCCASGYECDLANLGCKQPVVTTSIIAYTTTTITFYRSTLTSIGLTTTKIDTVTSTSTVTISSADTATLWETVTTPGLRKARAIPAGRFPSQPKQTSFSKTSIIPPAEPQQAPSLKGNVPRPHITELARSPQDAFQSQHLRKRTRTSTFVFTSTFYTTVTVDRAVSATYSVTTTLRTTIWQTSTTILNAKMTVRRTTTVLFQTDASITTSSSSSTNTSAVAKETSPEGGKGGLTKLETIGIIVGIVLGVIMTIATVWMCIRRRG